MKSAIKKLIEPILLVIIKRFCKAEECRKLTPAQDKHMHTLELKSRVRNGLDCESALIQLQELQWGHNITASEYDILEVFIMDNSQE